MNNPLTWLIYGANGWIGGQVCDILEKMGETIIKAKSRCDSETDVEKEIVEIKPDRIISLLGRTSGPGCSSIDYLEQKGKILDNVRDNLYSPMVLAILSKKYQIHYTYLGTGCIFDGYDGYDEESKPDFFGSGYSVVKGFTDRLMHFYSDNSLNVRIRMPIVSETTPKNFITKIITYSKICSVPNSMTVLPELLPKMIQMSKNKTTGTINLTNPGLISHNEILEMYKEIVDPNFSWVNFTIEEQSKILSAGRSNNLLKTDRLMELFPDVLPIKESVRNVLEKMKK
jgi:dTDP-4-dehydrorhamnose reductase